jgi:hypothetical protein
MVRRGRAMGPWQGERRGWVQFTDIWDSNSGHEDDLSVTVSLALHGDAEGPSKLVDNLSRSTSSVRPSRDISTPANGRSKSTRLLEMTRVLSFKHVKSLAMHNSIPLLFAQDGIGLLFISDYSLG